MAGSTHKRVFVARFDRGPLQGVVQTPEGFTTSALELLTPEGTFLKVPYEEIKAVCFIRDFEPGDLWRPHRAFQARPKTAGLWVRFHFRDGDQIEGLLPNNLLSMEAAGVYAVPPDSGPQNQRIFLPRQALTTVEVLGVIGSPLRGRTKLPAAAKPAREADKQLSMFD